jgi:hypothetical protein
LTAESFASAYEETAEILVGVEELAKETEAEIYVALELLYDYLDAGYTLSDALLESAYLTYVVEVSTDLMTILDEAYDSIVAGTSVDDAVTQYEEDIETAVTTAAYAITDLTVQELEEEV